MTFMGRGLGEGGRELIYFTRGGGRLTKDFIESGAYFHFLIKNWVGLRLFLFQLQLSKNASNRK